MKNCTQLLDLLATVGSEDLESTNRLLNDKHFILMYVSFIIFIFLSSHCDASGW